jgi:hypothetical protein
MKLFRRVVSIFAYVLAGMFLMGWATMSFMGGDDDLQKAFVMAFMAPFSLVPLAIGAIASPGGRVREIGIVLIVAAGWTAFMAVIMAVLLMDRKFMVTMPPATRESFAMFNDIAFGTAFTMAIGAIGFWFVLRKR